MKKFSLALLALALCAGLAACGGSDDSDEGTTPPTPENPGGVTPPPTEPGTPAPLLRCAP